MIGKVKPSVNVAVAAPLDLVVQVHIWMGGGMGAGFRQPEEKHRSFKHQNRKVTLMATISYQKKLSERKLNSKKWTSIFFSHKRL